jgi:hypothetical protein
MKKLAIIIIIGLFALSSNGQSFSYGELVDFKNLTPENKCTKLTMMGWTYLGDAEMSTREISDTMGYAWSKADEQIRFNDESVEYQWFGDSLHIEKKTKHKTVRTSISRAMFDSQVKYYRLKRKQGTYNSEELAKGGTVVSDYTYFVKGDFYSRFYHNSRTIFIGQIGGVI